MYDEPEFSVSLILILNHSYPKPLGEREPHTMQETTKSSKFHSNNNSLNIFWMLFKSELKHAWFLCSGTSHEEGQNGKVMTRWNRVNMMFFTQRFNVHESFGVSVLVFNQEWIACGILIENSSVKCAFTAASAQSVTVIYWWEKRHISLGLKQDFQMYPPSWDTSFLNHTIQNISPDAVNM